MSNKRRGAAAQKPAPQPQQQGAHSVAALPAQQLAPDPFQIVANTIGPAHAQLEFELGYPVIAFALTDAAQRRRADGPSLPAPARDR